MNLPPVISWNEDGAARSLRWHSEGGLPPPKRVVLADDGITADAAFRLASEGTALLWRGDFQNARQLLQALARRIERRSRKAPAVAAPAETFHLYRQGQSQRARTLGMLLLPFDDDYRIPLRRAPDVQAACSEAYGPPEGPFVASLRELLGLIGAHEWRKAGVPVPALDARIHPHYYGHSYYDSYYARRPCPPDARWRSTSAPVPACWRPYWRGAACNASSPPTWIRVPCPVPATT